VAGTDLPAADVTLTAGQYKATISKVTPSSDDGQQEESNQYVPDLHWLIPFAMCLTSPYHFQIA